MSQHRCDDVRSVAVEWLVRNGVEKPADLFYAWTPEEGAEKQAGKEVMEVWKELRSAGCVSIPSTGDMWIRSRWVNKKEAVEEKQEEEEKCGKRKTRERKCTNPRNGKRMVSTEVEKEGRKRAAMKAAEVARACGKAGELGKAADEAQEGRREEYWKRIVDRISCFEAPGVEAKIRTWRA